MMMMMMIVPELSLRSRSAVWKIPAFCRTLKFIALFKTAATAATTTYYYYYYY
jgi:hypothetical protein